MNSPAKVPSLVLAARNTGDGTPLYGFEKEHEPSAFR
jgi:hypothetical protein